MPMFLDSRASALENAAAGGPASREWLAARGNRLNKTPTQGFVMDKKKSSGGFSHTINLDGDTINVDRGETVLLLGGGGGLIAGRRLQRILTMCFTT